MNRLVTRSLRFISKQKNFISLVGETNMFQYSTLLHQQQLKQYQLKGTSLINKIVYSFSFPKHTRIAMPSLSPTMEKGIIQKWNFKEGDKVEIGDVICEVETDKSTVGFEVQENFYLAKILLPQGSKNVSIGDFIAVSVQSQKDVQAFQNYTLNDANTSQSAPQQQKTPETKQSAPQQKQQPKGGLSFKHKILGLPSLSPTMVDGKIVKWNVKEGDSVSEGDVICEVETDKSTVGFEVTENFIMGKILIQEGTGGIKLGDNVAIAVYKKEHVAELKNYIPGQHVSAEQPETQQQNKPAQTQTQTQTQTSTQTQTQTQQQTSTNSSGNRIFASPLAKNIATQKGISIADIGSGSGPNGRIIAQDVQNFKPQQKQAETASKKETTTTSTAASSTAKKEDKKPATTFTQAPNPFFDTENTSMRKTIAKRLLESKTQVPHFYLTIDCNVDKLITIRKQINEALNLKISVNDIIVKACAQALVDVPQVNSQWTNDYVRTFKNADISVAVATDKGLITPIIFDASRKTLSQISGDVKNLASKAKAGTLQPAEFIGGTFSISNLGMFGIDTFSAIINPPQACILAVSRSRKVAIVDDKDQFKVANMMNVTLSCDHRVVDGAIGAQWLAKFKGYVENPALLLA